MLEIKWKNSLKNSYIQQENQNHHALWNKYTLLNSNLLLVGLSLSRAVSTLVGNWKSNYFSTDINKN